MLTRRVSEVGSPLSAPATCLLRLSEIWPTSGWAATPQTPPDGFNHLPIDSMAVDLEIILRVYWIDILRGWEIPSTGIKSVRPERYFRKESAYCGV